MNDSQRNVISAKSEELRFALNFGWLVDELREQQMQGGDELGLESLPNLLATISSLTHFLHVLKLISPENLVKIQSLNVK